VEKYYYILMLQLDKKTMNISIKIKMKYIKLSRRKEE